MNEIVRQMKNYKWEINDDVVNIFPTKGRDEKFEELLDIKNYQVYFSEKVKVVRDIQLEYIKVLPELIKFISENNLYLLG